MAFTVSRHFDVTLTQGGADAFVQGTIATGLDPSDGIAFVLVGIEVVFPIPFGGTASNVQWSVTRDTKTAIAYYDDQDCLYSDGLGTIMQTSGMRLQQLRTEVAFDRGIFIVEPSIYAQLDSNATSAANTAYMRLHYEQQKVSELEILRLLNNV